TRSRHPRPLQSDISDRVRRNSRGEVIGRAPDYREVHNGIASRMQAQVGESGSSVNGENGIRCQTSSDIDPDASIDRRLPLPPDAFSGDITAMLGFTRLQGCTHNGPTRGRGGWAIPFHDKSV